MAGPERPEPAFRFTDPRQERIHRRLLLVGPGPAAFFRDACAFMAGAARLGTAAHLVAHLLREVESGLHSVLLPYDFEERGAPGRSAAEGSHKKQVKAILAAYGIDDSDDAARAWLWLAGWEEDTALARLAHRRGLGPPRDTEDVRRAWEEVQGLLDIVLEKFETRFLEPFRLLDELLAKPAPSAADVKRLRNNIPQNPVTLGFFFEKLQDPTWLPLLRKEEFFAHPPEPEHTEDGTILPPWPVSRYLSRAWRRSRARRRRYSRSRSRCR